MLAKAMVVVSEREGKVGKGWDETRHLDGRIYNRTGRLDLRR
jgi:hypothetical protein